MNSAAGRSRPKAIAFDVIGTLFKLETLRPRIEALGLPGSTLEGWMAAALRDVIALAATGDYRPFVEVQRAALDGVLAEQKLDPPEADRQAALDGMALLTPREGAGAALDRAVGAGVDVIALTNGSAESTRTLLAREGLLASITHIVSTDEVRLAKPRPEVYRCACEVGGAEPAELALVAAHPWDIQGGAIAGLITAYLDTDRPPSQVMRQPDITAGSLLACVDALLALPARSVASQPRAATQHA